MPQPPPKPLPLDPDTSFVLVPLHQYPEFTFQCATLLNMEWPRSRQARLNSLWSCSKNFPVALVLVQSDERQAVGFCKISLIPSVEFGCFVESVVINPDMRGKGLGTLLMKKLEDYVVSRKMQTLYLSTLGQEKFYKKLGYDECEPVSLYAFGLNSNSMCQSPQDENIPITVENSMNNLKIQQDLLCEKTTSVCCKRKTGNLQQSAPPPPPPPPLPKTLIGKNVMTVKTYMKKELTKM